MYGDDPRPWHRAIEQLPECFVLDRFEWQPWAGAPRLQLRVFEVTVSVQPAYGPALMFVVYAGTLDEPHGLKPQCRVEIENALLPRRLPFELVLDIRVAALDVVGRAIRPAA